MVKFRPFLVFDDLFEVTNNLRPLNVDRENTARIIAQDNTVEFQAERSRHLTLTTRVMASPAVTAVSAHCCPSPPSARAGREIKPGRGIHEHEPTRKCLSCAGKGEERATTTNPNNDKPAPPKVALGGLRGCSSLRRRTRT